METPTLSKKQRKATLSSKKARKETIKNVLATPFESYWPEISNGDQIILIEALSKGLPLVKSEKINVPWTVLKDIPKKERKQCRNDYVLKHSKAFISNQTCTYKKSADIMLGINEGAKAIENQTVGAVLITADVTPRKMVHHIIDMAVLHKISVLIVPNLRRILKHHCGVSSITIAIANNLKTESSLERILATIHSIYKKYLPPIRHINYNRSQDNDISIVPDTISIAARLQSIPSQNKDLDQLGSRGNKFHLQRISVFTRAFIPELSDGTQKHYSKISSDQNDFVPFSSQVSPNVKAVHEHLYKSVVVKRIKGNKNRMKNKLELFKRKKKKA